MEQRSPPPLTVAISTVAQRAHAVLEERLPHGTAWVFHIICQFDKHAANNERAHQHLSRLVESRSDISFELMDERGVARSRNRALAVVSSEFLLFSDDDVRLVRDGLVHLISAFRENPRVALIAGRTLGADGKPIKRYPDSAAALTKFNSAKIGTVELAVRPAEVRRANISFDTSFGAGTANFLGDEYIFVTDALAAGLRGVALPIGLAVHDHASSGQQWSDVTAIVRGRVFDRVFKGPERTAVKLAFLARNASRMGGLGALANYARAFLSSSRG